MRRPGVAFLAAFILMLISTLATAGVGVALFGLPAFAQKAVDQPSNVRGPASPSGSPILRAARKFRKSFLS